MTASPHTPAVDPFDLLLELCDTLREVEELPEGKFKTLYRLEARLQIRTHTFTLLLPAPRSDSVTTYDHHKEARHN